jgi:hypothetical protein
MRTLSEGGHGETAMKRGLRFYVLFTAFALQQAKSISATQRVFV